MTQIPASIDVSVPYRTNLRKKRSTLCSGRCGVLALAAVKSAKPAITFCGDTGNEKSVIRSGDESNTFAALACCFPLSGDDENRREQ
jgi:hypothetical protein